VVVGAPLTRLQQLPTIFGKNGGARLKPGVRRSMVTSRTAGKRNRQDVSTMVSRRSRRLNRSPRRHRRRSGGSSATGRGSEPLRHRARVVRLPEHGPGDGLGHRLCHEMCVDGADDHSHYYSAATVTRAPSSLAPGARGRTCATNRPLIQVPSGLRLQRGLRPGFPQAWLGNWRSEPGTWFDTRSGTPAT
jgi:hypothetical protein